MTKKYNGEEAFLKMIKTLAAMPKEKQEAMIKEIVKPSMKELKARKAHLKKKGEQPSEKELKFIKDQGYDWGDL